MTLSWDVGLDRIVEIESPASCARGSRLTGEREFGRDTTLGDGAIINGPVAIGRSEQIGADAGILGSTHPTDRFCQNVGKYLGDIAPGLGVDERVTRGSVVWAGQGAILLPGVKISSGAIVVASAVVTEDVEPFPISYELVGHRDREDPRALATSAGLRVGTNSFCKLSAVLILREGSQ